MIEKSKSGAVGGIKTEKPSKRLCLRKAKFSAVLVEAGYIVPTTAGATEYDGTSEDHILVNMA